MLESSAVKTVPAIPVLGYLGFLPFVAAAWLSATEWSPLSLDPGRLFVSYSAIILAFLSGALWGRALTVQFEPVGANMLVLSNVLALIAWSGVLLGFASVLSYLLLMLGYALIAGVEFRHRDLLFSELPSTVRQSYLRLRLVLTVLVLLAHVLMVIFL